MWDISCCRHIHTGALSIPPLITSTEFTLAKATGVPEEEKEEEEEVFEVEAEVEVEVEEEAAADEEGEEEEEEDEEREAERGEVDFFNKVTNIHGSSFKSNGNGKSTPSTISSQSTLPST